MIVCLPGVSGESARDSWDETKWDTTLLDAHRELIALRHAHPALRSAGYRTVSATGHLYACERFDESERVLVAVSAGESTATTTLDATPRHTPVERRPRNRQRHNRPGPVRVSVERRLNPTDVTSPRRSRG
jgi:cyclomaltodextrinase